MLLSIIALAVLYYRLYLSILMPTSNNIGLWTGIG